jgi:hypothetical protein
MRLPRAGIAPPSPRPAALPANTMWFWDSEGVS